MVELPNVWPLLQIAGTLALAALLGGVIGTERESMGKSAGARTHMLVSLGAALFVLVPRQAGLETGDVSRVIQGIATGIGFIGAGTILKRKDSEEIQGLTSAAAIWMTGAIGVAVGAGEGAIAAIAVVLALVILAIFRGIARWLERS